MQSAGSSSCPSGDDGKKTTPSAPTTGGVSSNKPASSAPAKSSSTAKSSSDQALAKSSAAEPAAKPATFDPHGSTKPTDSQTIPEIKAYLDSHNITYASNASKADLLALANK